MSVRPGFIRARLRATRDIRERPTFSNGEPTAEVAREEIRRDIHLFNLDARRAELQGYQDRARANEVRSTRERIR